MYRAKDTFRAKVHKKDVPLRPVLSLPGSCYENLTNELAKLFDQVAGAAIETSTEKARNSIAAAELDRDEVMISLDVKSLYTNVTVDESIALAAELVEETGVLDFSKETFVELMELAVKDVCLQVGHNWYQQRDGLAMGSKLAVFLANIWLKSLNRFRVVGARTSWTPSPHGRARLLQLTETHVENAEVV